MVAGLFFTFTFLLNFLHHVLISRRGKASAKILSIFKMVCYFSVSAIANMDPLKGGSGQMSSMPFLHTETDPTEDLMLFFVN